MGAPDMKHSEVGPTSAAQVILSLDPRTTGHYLRDQVKARALSSTMKALNRDILDGSPQERANAIKALKLLGFDHI